MQVYGLVGLVIPVAERFEQFHRNGPVFAGCSFGRFPIFIIRGVPG